MRLTILISTFILVCTFSLCWVAGFFDGVVIEHQPIGPYNLIYRQVQGPYQKYQYAMGDVGRFLHGRGVRNDRGFLIIKNDQPQGSGREWVGIAGCVVDSLPQSLPSPYEGTRMERVSGVTGSLPLRSFFSTMTASGRLRSALSRDIEKQGLKSAGACIEIFDKKNRMIHYAVPVTKP